MTLVAMVMILSEVHAVWLLMNVFMYIIVGFKRLTIPEKSIIVCTELSDPKQNNSHRQVGVGRMVSSGLLGGVVVITLTRNARDVGSIPDLCTIFRLVIIPTTYMGEALTNALTRKYNVSM